MNKSPIGVFDSGIGGLSVLKEIRALLPHEDLIYIADSGFAPYGNKGIAFIQERCHKLTHFLLEQGAKAVVVACNTATAAAVVSLREGFSLPIIAMEPGVRPAIAATRCKRIGVLATENTLASKQFLNLVHRYAADVTIFNQPCPGLVEQIESGELDGMATLRLLERFIQPLLEQGVDTLVLGCTHYPLLRRQIEAMLHGTVTVIDTGRAVAQQLQRRLGALALLSDQTRDGQIQFWSSGSTAAAAVLQGLWHQSIDQVQHLDV